MKEIKFLAITLFFLIPFSIKSQNTDNLIIFSNTHGLKQGKALYFEVEGYSVFSYDHELLFDKKGIKKVKKQYKVDKSNPGFIDSSIVENNRVFIQFHKVSENLTQTYIYYLIAQKNNKIKAIGFSVNSTRDIQLEKLFVKSIIENSVPQNVYSNLNINNINFAGRVIQLGSACKWMGPHNIQCPDFGQMNWSEHRSMDRAKAMLDAQLEITESRSMGEVLQRDSVDIIFEGKESKALKTKYRIKIPRLIMGGSNILIIYYVLDEVRGKYVACVFSHYTDDVNARNLAPLLKEFMELK